MPSGRWRTAFVSGGGSGIGLRLAELLAARGARVWVFDLSIGSEARERLARAAEPAGAGPLGFYEVDIRDAPELDGAVSEAAGGADGVPDLAINSAGILVCKAFEELAVDEFQRMVDVNLVGSRNFAAAALPRMAPGGRLALVASLAGIVPNYGYTAYNASKFGVVGLAGALRLECKPKGIGVSVICPPEVETPMVAKERAAGNPIGLQLKAFSGTLPLEEACDEILAGLDAGSWMIVPGRRARLTRRLTRFLPGLMNAISDRMVRQALGENA